MSRDMDLWAYQRGITLDFFWPGKPTDNAYIAAFNGRFRAECLNAQNQQCVPLCINLWPPSELRHLKLQAYSM